MLLINTPGVGGIGWEVLFEGLLKRRPIRAMHIPFGVLRSGFGLPVLLELKMDRVMVRRENWIGVVEELKDVVSVFGLRDDEVEDAAGFIRWILVVERVHNNEVLVIAVIKQFLAG